MPAYRFDWDLFDDRTVTALAADIGHAGAPSQARDYLRSHVARPSDEFVLKTKRSLARIWLPQHGRIGAAIVRELFDDQIGPMGRMPTDAEGCAAYIDRCRNTSGLRGRLVDRLISFGDRDKSDSYAPEGDFVPRFFVVRPPRLPSDDRRAYPHQLDAWSAMDKENAVAQSTGVFKGVVVMPTGAGKTRTAVHWLLRRWVDAGKRVLWIAHRNELLRQAAKTFYELAPLAVSREQLRIRLVSGAGCRFHQIDPADDVVMCSVHSLSRALELARPLLSDPRVFVVIDEAHHAPARSYRDAIAILEQADSHHLLGLTATPTRTAEQERPELSRLFGHKEIYQVSPAHLIARELLARPIPVTVATGVDAEQGMTSDDVEYLRDFHDVSPEMRERLGRDEARNLAIVRHYLEHHARYGKTLVFAPDVQGAALLTDLFRARLPDGMHAEYIASYRMETDAPPRTQTRDILEDFRRPDSGLNVLVNVDMLTEGVDLPMTRSVFLARPTSSEILLRQMIGRALRGPAAGGHREAYIVSFEDHWATVGDVLSPIQLVVQMAGNLAAESPAVAAAPAPRAAAVVTGAALPPLSWDRVLAVSQAIRAALPDPDADVFEAVPHGMYRLEYTVDEEAVQHFVHVYEHQRSCWDALLQHVTSHGADTSQTADMLRDEFFGDCDDPVPSARDVDTVAARMRAGDPHPACVPLEGRDQCDPRELARIAKSQDLRTSDIDRLLAERYSALARVIYPKPVEFRQAFDDALRELSLGPSRGHPGASCCSSRRLTTRCDPVRITTYSHCCTRCSPPAARSWVSRCPTTVPWCGPSACSKAGSGRRT
jgi:superfamily II DNA or RNA helicase